MMSFEVGKEYECNDCGISNIKVLKRTEKTLWVENDVHSQWRMRIREDEHGYEYVTDSTVPRKWREAFTYSARWVVNEN
jgi:hypothetical protein